MIRSGILQIFLFAVGVLTISFPAGALSEEPISKAAKSSGQANQTDAAPVRGSSPDAEITDADRMLRLGNASETDRNQLRDFETELKKTQAEEADANAAVQQLSTRIEDLKGLLEKALDSGNQGKAAEQESLLSDLATKYQLAAEQFNLAIQARKTVQKQIAMLQQKIAADRESLDKLKGVSAPETAKVDLTSTASTGPAQSANLNSTADSKLGSESEANELDDAESKKETVISKDLAKAQEAVQEKAASLQDIEEDLSALEESKTLLEKSIELESEKLSGTREKYDALETALEIAENEFNEKLRTGTPAGELQQLRTQVSDIQKRMREARGEIRSSTDRLQESRNQLLTLQAEETQMVKRSDELQAEMAAAKRSEWVLKGRDYLYVTVPKVAVILVLAFILWTLVKLFCGRSRSWIARTGLGTSTERQNRADTLAGVFQNTGNLVIVVGSVLMVLDASGVPIAALLGGAGVVGLAVAFGAQSLIKDFFCGLILLLENQYKVNDFVTIGSLGGVVERITLRVTVLRDFEGKVYFIPNGQITSVTNASMDWSRAVLEISVAYRENVDQVIESLKQLGSEMREEPEYRDVILGDVEMLGVDNLGDSSVVIKFGLKTRPDKKWPVKREMLRRVKNSFDEQGIEIPFPHQTVIYRTESGSSAKLVA